MNLRSIWFSFVFLIATNTVTRATDMSWELKGITNAGYKIYLSNMASKCGLDEQAMQTVMLLPIKAYTQIHLVESDKITDIATMPRIKLTVSVVSTPNAVACAAHIQLNVDVFAIVNLPQPQPSEHKVGGALVIWSMDNMMLTHKDTIPSSVMNAVQSMAKTLALDWQTANK
jgi:hypothetical protein